MRIPVTLLLSVLIFYNSRAQVTLVRSAPNDSFNLACPRCALTVVDVSITEGQHALPMNLQKPVAVNLLFWRYYDKILGRDVLTRKEQIWTTSIQLLDELPDDELLSLHINLDWTDSSGQVQQFYLVVAGLARDQLTEFPLESTYEPDTYSLRRFAAIAQFKDAEGNLETYDCIEGTCSLYELNLKTGAIGGQFEFKANRVGMEKQRTFLNGVFRR